MSRIVRYIFEKGGKRCRATLLLLCAEMLDCRMERALDAAVAIELIHTSSIIFDDIIDNEKIRRNSQPLHIAFGEGVAITCGLFLASKAVEILSHYDSKEIMRAIGTAIVTMSQGEMLDVFSQGEEGVEEYLKIISFKTGAMFSASAEIGALVAGASRDQVECLSECGRLIGISFQMRDDIADLNDGEKMSVYNDLTVETVSRLSVEYAGRAKDLLRRKFGEKSNRIIEFIDHICGSQK
ncbi:polyprenyl synthetase family protein [Candidatus Bathyarchaeota archaeon]|nr:polyprenyl synthetase family protein [Candidatus Bathyarchaeota archaeon]